MSSTAHPAGELSWHDNPIYAIHFDVGDASAGDWRCDLVLDIDHILDWICAVEGSVRFRLAPATLVFHDVTDLRMALDFTTVSHPQTMMTLSIAAITSEPVPWPWSPAALPYHRWRIDLNVPVGGAIAFGASGFTQTMRAEPVVVDEQRWPNRDRPPLRLRS
jgi:hypothetical protein